MILTQMLLCPVIGLLVALALPKNRPGWIRAVAITATAAALLLGVKLLLAFDPNAPGIQFQQRISWIAPLNVYYNVGVDGLSLPMVMLTVLLGFIACLASNSIKTRHKEYYVLYLLLVAGMLGTFIALDLFLFYVFWEMVLVPMYFLIGIWGGGRREYSAFKFFVYTLAGSMGILLSILTLYFRTQTFDILTLTATGHSLELGLQKLLFIGFFVGFAVKVPLFPFHTWLPDAHVDAPTPISVILAGVLLKMGGYAFLRIGYPILPDGARSFGWLMAGLGAIGVVYGAFVALAQTDLKKLVAYSSVSHMGFVAIGLASLTPEGVHGALFQMFSHGIVTGGMFLLVGVLYERTHTRSLDAFGGLGVRVPKFSALFIFFSMASLGLPGLSGFVGEFLSLLGAYGSLQKTVIFATIGIVMTAAYTLTATQKVLLGPLNEKWKALPDVDGLEMLTLVPLLVLTLVIGVYPLFLIGLQDASVQRFLTQVLGA